MYKLYEKKEVLFAVLWIVAYCVILGTIRGNFGDESIYMLLALLVFTAGIIAFVKANHLEGKYGLAGWPKDMKKYLFLLVLCFVATTMQATVVNYTFDDTSVFPNPERGFTDELGGETMLSDSKNHVVKPEADWYFEEFGGKQTERTAWHHHG